MKYDQVEKFEQEAEWVVISRHPYDIVGMSFDRGWDSCMNAEKGMNKRYLLADIEYGGLVAYLTKAKNGRDVLNNPIARISLKPFFKGRSKCLVLSKVYGVKNAKFEDIVSKFIAKLNINCSQGLYYMPHALYPDGQSKSYFHLVDEDLDVLTLDENEQHSLAGNIRTPKKMLEHLYGSDYETVIQNLFTNRRTPSELYRKHEDKLIRTYNTVDDNKKNLIMYIETSPNIDARKFNDFVINLRDATSCIALAPHKGADIAKLQQIIIDSKDAQYCYEFAKNVKGADIAKLQQIIIDRKAAKYCYEFAKNVKGANIAKLQQAVLDKNDAQYCYEFAKNVKGANIENIQYYYELSKLVKVADKSKLQEEFINIEEEYFD